MIPKHCHDTVMEICNYYGVEVANIDVKDKLGSPIIITINKYPSDETMDRVYRALHNELSMFGEISFDKAFTLEDRRDLDKRLADIWWENYRETKEYREYERQLEESWG